MISLKEFSDALNNAKSFEDIEEISNSLEGDYYLNVENRFEKLHESYINDLNSYCLQNRYTNIATKDLESAQTMKGLLKVISSRFMGDEPVLNVCKRILIDLYNEQSKEKYNPSSKIDNVLSNNNIQNTK